MANAWYVLYHSDGIVVIIGAVTRVRHVKNTKYTSNVHTFVTHCARIILAISVSFMKLTRFCHNNYSCFLDLGRWLGQVVYVRTTLSLRTCKFWCKVAPDLTGETDVVLKKLMPLVQTWFSRQLALHSSMPFTRFMNFFALLRPGKSPLHSWEYHMVLGSTNGKNAEQNFYTFTIKWKKGMCHLHRG